MKTGQKIGIAGFLSTAVAFGPARMAYGLFLPEIQKYFDLTPEQAGFIASFAFFIFLLSLVSSALLVNSKGPKVATLCGAICAGSGMLTVGFAESLVTLSFGVALSTASAGFLWTPFNELVESLVSESKQDSTLSLISTGTSFGILSAGILHLFTSGTAELWRNAWLIFSAFGFLALVINTKLINRVKHTSPLVASPPLRSSLSQFLKSKPSDLILVALSTGFTNALYFSFAVDYTQSLLPNLAESGMEAGALIYLAYGIGGISGLFAGQIKAWIGLRLLLLLIFSCSMASHLSLVLVKPAFWVVTLSALLQGSFIMMMSATLAFWTLHRFPKIPTHSFSFVLFAMAAGNVLGPAVGGLMNTSFNYSASFMTAFFASLLSALMVPLFPLRQQPLSLSQQPLCGVDR